jgi:hypothetical protein
MNEAGSWFPSIAPEKKRKDGKPSHYLWAGSIELPNTDRVFNLILIDTGEKSFR